MEHFFDLLQEGLAVKLGGRDEGVLSKEDVLASEGRVEVLVQNVQRLLVTAVQDYLDGVLQVDRHLVALQILLSFLAESVFGSHLLTLQAED